MVLDEKILYLLSLSIFTIFIVSCAFAALTLVLRAHNQLQERLWARLDAIWSQDLLEVLGGDEDPAQLIQKVSTNRRIEFVKFLTPYALRLRGSDADKLSQLAMPFLPLVARRLRSRNEGKRAWAVHALSLFGLKEYESRIYQSLDDKSPIVSILAANALLSRGDNYYLDAVLGHLHRFENWSVISLTSLLSQSSTKSLPILRKYYFDENVNIRARIISAEVLSRLKDYEIADQVVRQIDQQSDRELLSASLRLLGSIGHDEHKNVVIEQTNSPDEIIRFNAVKALHAIGNQNDLEIFRQRIEDDSSWVASEAAIALRDFRDTNYLELLATSDHPRAELARQVLFQGS